MEAQDKPLEQTDEPVKNVAASETQNSGSKIPLIIAAVVLLLAGIIYLLIRLGPVTTGHIREVSMVVYALSSVVLIAALVVVILQTIKLINFLKQEVTPILHTAKKSIKQVSGTISFLSDTAVEPTKNAVSTFTGVKNAADGILSLIKK